MRTQTDGGDAVLAGGLTRRTLLQRAAGLGVAASTLGALDLLALAPARAEAKKTGLPEIQFEIEKLLTTVHSEGVKAQFGPVYTTFATLTLSRTPTTSDQATLANALAQIEAAYPFTPAGLLMTIAYGLPYFDRLPESLVAANMPKLISEPTRWALEEAVPGPTDVSPQNPEITKQRFNVPVQIESNELLLTLRSDSSVNIEEALSWLVGEGSTLAGRSVAASGLAELLQVTSRRLMFLQQGLPRRIAEEEGLEYAETINPASPMWMGFVSQQVKSAAKAATITFEGKGQTKMTTAKKKDYFDLGAVQHLSHVIQDLGQFYERPDETYIRRVAEMFAAAPVPREGSPNQFANGGGPAFVPNLFNPHAAEREAEGKGTFDNQAHIGHLSALQRTSRTANGQPLHIRADGPGYDTLDVPGGEAQPKLHFSIFVPTAAFFATMRTSQASLDLAKRYAVPSNNLGLERFLTATRRQNFLVPPRRNRAFPLVELA